MKLLLTGSQGRIGRPIARELEKRFSVRRIDLRGFETETEPIEFLEGDLMNPDTCAKAVEGVEAIIHLAGIPGPRRDTYAVNTVSTWNLLSAAREAGVKRVVIASSINVYGQGNFKIGRQLVTPPYLPIDEKVPVEPEDGYGLSKLANEQAALAFTKAYGMRAYCFRLPAVWLAHETERFRPRPLDQVPPLAANRLIDPWIYIDVRDVASAFAAAVEKPDIPDFGVSYLTAEDTTRPESTEELFNRFLPEWLPLLAPMLRGRRPWFCSAAAKRDLGWSPRRRWQPSVQPSLSVVESVRAVGF